MRFRRGWKPFRVQLSMVSSSRWVPTRRTSKPLSERGQAMALPMRPAPTIVATANVPLDGSEQPG